MTHPRPASVGCQGGAQRGEQEGPLTQQLALSSLLEGVVAIAAKNAPAVHRTSSANPHKCLILATSTMKFHDQLARCARGREKIHVPYQVS